MLAYSYRGHRPHRWSYYRFPLQSLCPDTVGVLETSFVRLNVDLTMLHTHRYIIISKGAGSQANRVVLK